MSENPKFAVIKDYLKRKFPNSTIDQRIDFDRGAQTFKVIMTGNTLLLKVGNEFVSDNEAPEIVGLFDRWSLAEILEKETELGVLVTARGVETFRRGT